jgi:hypothetical protein
VATNFYFNNFTSSMEQQLIEDLIVESIRVFGHDAWYIHRTLIAKDDLLNEDDLSEFDSAFMMEMYIKNVEGFEGEGDFLSKFGLQIRDSITFTIAMKTFAEEIGLYEAEIRPNEGDLIYFPLNNKIFEVQHVEHEAIFYQMGSLQTYDLRCELFEYSQERFDTGVPEIDTLYDKHVITSDTAVANAEVLEIIDTEADNFVIETEADSVLDFTEADPFSEGGSW